MKMMICEAYLKCEHARLCPHGEEHKMVDGWEGFACSEPCNEPTEFEGSKCTEYEMDTEEVL